MKAALVALGLCMAAPAAGQSGAQCGGTSGLWGGVISQGFTSGSIELGWRVADASIRDFRLSRFPVGCNRSSCATRVARVSARRSSALETYSLVDTAPAGNWIYQVEVRYSHGSCTMTTGEIHVASPPPCDGAALCAQVAASFAAERGGAGTGAGTGGDAVVRLEWITSAEIGAGSYRLSRSTCSGSAGCLTEIAAVDATGGCGQVMVRRVDDVAPAGTRTYVLDVLDSGGRAACSLRVAAPALSPSSR